MRCTNKLLAGLLAVVLAFTASGCGTASDKLANRYPVYQMSFTSDQADVTGNFFGTSRCVGGISNVGEVNDPQVAVGAGVFNTATGEIPYAQNIYDPLYPASTTKILTAYIALKEGNLDDVITVSENALNLDPDSSTCGLIAGDQITLRDLLFGLMMKSGNDAAVAIAEYISGDVTAFAAKMNEEARMLGATKSNFVNPQACRMTIIIPLYTICI